MKKKEKIYVISISWAFDGESGFEIQDTYTDYEKAQADFKDILKKELENWDLTDEDTIIEEDKTYWEAYIDGYYNDRHVCVYLKERI